jgi:drug/metabolite transporter (DMT)-like permease
MLSAYAIALLATLLTAVSQLLLKYGVLRWKGTNPLFLYLNPCTMGGYFLLLAAMVLYNHAFQQIQLKSIVFFLPITLVLVTLASRWLFREKMTLQGLLGAGLIILGLVVYGL